MDYPTDPLTRFTQGKHVPKTTLEELARDGYIILDPHDNVYRITTKGNKALALPHAPTGGTK